ncbi:response regulator [uncultured Desulfosarcina sp.]|uniref:CBS domain-containing protein n=1 Tax=uncultured Desulfosarcina sp. TaxID=218289 RepID=UPI0029C60D59|nr:response regulator [uncultured Desulfosarcina sp.]
MVERREGKAGRRVLLVDDEARFVLQLGKLLEARDFEVASATDGRQALTLMETRRFDAVLLDLRMPGLGGMATLARIQQQKQPPAVIILTGHATLESGIEAIRQGAFDYLIKPCGIEELEAKLNQACEAGQIRRNPVLWPRSVAGELVLEAFRRIADTDPLLEAVSIFNHRLPRMGGETLYIVDGNGRLTGHLSKADILAKVAGAKGGGITWAQLSSNPQWLPALTVGDVMNPDTVAVKPETALDRVAATMIERGFHTLPVIDENRQVLGVIQLKDVLVYLEGPPSRMDQNRKDEVI